MHSLLNMIDAANLPVRSYRTDFARLCALRPPVDRLTLTPLLVFRYISKNQDHKQPLLRVSLRSGELALDSPGGHLCSVYLALRSG
jgi:hypothetical protein